MLPNDSCCRVQPLWSFSCSCAVQWVQRLQACTSTSRSGVWKGEDANLCRAATCTHPASSAHHTSPSLGLGLGLTGVACSVCLLSELLGRQVQVQQPCCCQHASRQHASCQPDAHTPSRRQHPCRTCRTDTCASGQQPCSGAQPRPFSRQGYPQPPDPCGQHPSAHTRPDAKHGEGPYQHQ